MALAAMRAVMSRVSNNARVQLERTRIGAGTIGALALACAQCRAPQDTSPTAEATRTRSPPCTAAAVQAAAPPGMKIGAIDDLNARLPGVPSGALLVPASGTTPPYCLVTGSVVTKPSTGPKMETSANFGVALPLGWNHEFLFSGCGGRCGVVFQTTPDDQRGGGYPSDALAKGYAIAATDDGHASDPSGFVSDGARVREQPGVPREDAVTDFHVRAVHAVTLASKELVRGWYAGAVARAYCFGCSHGGREEMVELTRFPKDFDGYIVGDPFDALRDR